MNPDLDLRPSMGRVGSRYEMPSRRAGSRPRRPRSGRRRATREQARADVFRFIAHYNRHRRHSTINYLTPEHAEQRYRHVELPLAA